MPRFICPLAGRPKIVSGYPKRNNSFGEVIRTDGTYPSGPGTTIPDEHLGVDYAVPVGTPLLASADGKVIRADCNDTKGYGNQIRVFYPEVNLTGVYGHLSEILVKVGQKVKQGQIIGKTGGAKGAPGSGSSQGPHLHETILFGEMATGKATLANTLDPRKVVEKYKET